MNRRLMILALAGLTLSACATTPNIASDTTPGANLSAYKTYTIVNTQPPAGMNPVAFERVKQGVEGQMAAKGYTKADPAQLSIILTLGAKDKTDYDTWGRWGLQTDVYQYTEGKISVDVFNTQTKEALWHGSANAQVDPNKPNNALLDQAVMGVMAKFPGRAA